LFSYSVKRALGDDAVSLDDAASETRSEKPETVEEAIARIEREKAERDREAQESKKAKAAQKKD
jgi:hypothetical protein